MDCFSVIPTSQEEFGAFTKRIYQLWTDIETKLQASLDHLDLVNRQMDYIRSGLACTTGEVNQDLSVNQAKQQLQHQLQVLDGSRQVYLEYSTKRAEEMTQLSRVMESAGIALPVNGCDVEEEDFYLDMSQEENNPENDSEELQFVLEL